MIWGHHRAELGTAEGDRDVWAAAHLRALLGDIAALEERIAAHRDDAVTESERWRLADRWMRAEAVLSAVQHGPIVGWESVRGAERRRAYICRPCAERGEVEERNAWRAAPIRERDPNAWIVTGAACADCGRRVGMVAA